MRATTVVSHTYQWGVEHDTQHIPDEGQGLLLESLWVSDVALDDVESSALTGNQSQLQVKVVLHCVSV